MPESTRMRVTIVGEYDLYYNGARSVAEMAAWEQATFQGNPNEAVMALQPRSMVIRVEPTEGNRAALGGLPVAGAGIQQSHHA